MAERELDVVIKAQNETNAAMASVLASVKELANALDGGGNGNSVNAAAANAGMSMTRLLVTAIAGATVVFAPFIVALGAIIANLAAMSVLAIAGVGPMLALGAAIFGLGSANAGGLNPAETMIKAHHTLDTAIKEHTEALKELKQAQAGMDIFGGLSQAETLRLAQAYVVATGSKVGDAQHDLREPASGLGGPIANLGSGIDDLRHHFEEISRPFAEHIAMWAMQFLPAIEKAGDALAKWFGDRLPQILNFFSGVMKISLGGFFDAIGKVVDYVLAHQAEFINFFSDIVKFGVGAFKFLLEAAVNIHEWFKSNWPTIVSFVNAFLDGFKAWGPVIVPLLGEMKRLLGDVGAHITSLTPLWNALGAVVGAVVTGILGLLGGMLLALRAVGWSLDVILGKQGQINAGTNRPGGHSGGSGPSYHYSAPALGSPNVAGIIGL